MILDFSEAQAKIREDENQRRIDEGLTVGLTKEVRRTAFGGGGGGDARGSSLAARGALGSEEGGEGRFLCVRCRGGAGARRQGSKRCARCLLRFREGWFFIRPLI